MIKVKTLLVALVIVQQTFHTISSLADDSAAAPTTSTNQTTPVTDELTVLRDRIQEKLDRHLVNEADFADELKGLDDLIAKSGKSETSAHATYLKSVLFFQCFHDLEKSESLFQQIKTDYPNTKYAKQADRLLPYIKMQIADKKVQDGLIEGAIPPDFSVTDTQGKPLSLANYKGKVVLIDFWETGCIPWRSDLPKLISIYNKIHPQGFEIIGVNMDTDRATLDTFLKENGITWPQYSDGQEFANKLVKEYGVETTPFNVLIGRDGKIIDTKLRAEDLDDALNMASHK